MCSLQSQMKESNTRNTRNTEKQCYTCFPSGEVTRHIVHKTFYTTFHFDMWNRSMFIATPNFHFHSIHEMSPVEQATFWNDVHVFLEKMEFHDYQCVFNNGDWQSHHHFHVKIRVDEKRIRQLRKEHLLKNPKVS